MLTNYNGYIFYYVYQKIRNYEIFSAVFNASCTYFKGSRVKWPKNHNLKVFRATGVAKKWPKDFYVFLHTGVLFMIFSM